MNAREKVGWLVLLLIVVLLWMLMGNTGRGQEAAPVLLTPAIYRTAEVPNGDGT